MSILMQLKKDNLQAMKDHDVIKKGVLSLLVSALALAEKEKKEPLSDEESYALIQKELKQTKESLELTPADRTDLIEESKKKIEIIQGYLPEQMSHDEILKAINEIISEKGLEPVKKSQGIIMKEMLAKYKGKTDGQTVNKVAAEILK